jgi:hypothetical protein
LFLSFNTSAILHVQQDTRIVRTTCENLIPKGQEIFREITETWKNDKLLVSIDLAANIVTLNVKPKYFSALWMLIKNRDGSVDFKACSKDMRVSAKWVQIQHYSKA